MKGKASMQISTKSVEKGVENGMEIVPDTPFGGGSSTLNKVLCIEVSGLFSEAYVSEPENRCKTGGFRGRFSTGKGCEKPVRSL
jgi:hypothetical protein